MSTENSPKTTPLKRLVWTAGVAEALDGLKLAAQTEENVMPHMLSAVKKYATLGEITKVLKQVFGEFKEPVGL